MENDRAWRKIKIQMVKYWKKRRKEYKNGGSMIYDDNALQSARKRPMKTVAGM